MLYFRAIFAGMFVMQLCVAGYGAQNASVAIQGSGDHGAAVLRAPSRKTSLWTYCVAAFAVAAVGGAGVATYKAVASSENSLRSACLEAQTGVDEVLNVTTPLYEAVNEVLEIQKQMRKEQLAMMKELARVEATLREVEENCSQNRSITKKPRS